MKLYFNVLAKLANTKHVLVLLVAFVSTYVLLNFTNLPFSIPEFQAETGGKTILNLLPYYSSDMAYEYIAAYSEKAVSIYHLIILADLFVLIPIYVLFLAAAIYHSGTLVLRNRARYLLNTLTALPLVAAVLNIIEDGVIVFLLAEFPNRYESIATICGVLTSTKSLFILLSMISAVVLYLLVGLSRAAFAVGMHKCHV